jgi:hypothetical protein
MVAATGMRPEAELLLYCARTHMEPHTAARITALVQADLDWAFVVETALQHRTMPLLHSSLRATCTAAVPQPMLEQLQEYFYANAAQNRFLIGELLRLLQLLENHAIAAIPLKGPVLAASVYGHVALRQFGDLDILVPQRHVLQAKELLLGKGYRPMRQFSHAQETAHLESFHAYSLVREDGRVAVDLHWTVMPSYFAVSLDPKGLWERLEPIDLVGTAVLSQPLEDVLLFLCIHGFKHGWEWLGWICDVAELLRVHQRMDWGRVLEQAEASGSLRILLLGLLLANDLLGATLPEGIARRLRTDPSVTTLGTQVRAQLFREADGSPKVFATLRFRLRGR